MHCARNGCSMKKSEFIRKYNGARFMRTVSGMATIEDTDQMRDELQAIADRHGLQLQEDETTWQIDTRVWFKPKMHKVATYKIVFRSVDYDVIDDTIGGKGERVSGGTIPKAADFTARGFIVKVGERGIIEYTPITEG